MELRGPMPFATGLGVSLIAHVAFLVRFLTVEPRNPPEPPSSHQELVVEVVGLVSDRQIDEQRAADGLGPSGASLPAPPPSPRPREVKNRAKPPNTVAPSPRPVLAIQPLPDEPATDGIPATPEAPAVAAATNDARPAPAASGGAEVERVQRTVQATDPSDALVLRKYVRELTRVIQSRLVYPPEARAIGYIGTPVIRFTVMVGGDILAGSLAVARSSGYELLDANALKAARESAPLPPPPRQMTVSIFLAFAREP